MAKNLKELVLQSHVVLRLKTNTGAEDVGESSTLFGESVDDRSAARGERSLTCISSVILSIFSCSTYLQHVAEDAQNTVEASVLVCGNLSAVSLPLDTSHDLSDKDKINDQRSSQKRVLADIE